MKTKISGLILLASLYFALGLLLSCNEGKADPSQPETAATLLEVIGFVTTFWSRRA